MTAALRVALALALLAGGAPVAPWVTPVVAAELDQTELERLESEGREWFGKAGDPSASRDARNEALREAYTRLKQAWSLLDAWCDAHPEQIEALDAQMGRINKMLFWVKKEAPLGVLTGRGPAPRTDSPGGTTPSTPPVSGPAAESPPIAAPSAAVPTPLELARRHDAARPGDLSGALELWLAALAACTDDAAPERAEALARVADLNDRLREAYRELRDDDPDSIQVEAEPGQEAVVAARLVAQLGSADPAVRRRSALELGALGYTPAAQDLFQAARSEKTPDVRDAVFDGLARLGGRRTCEALARLAKDRRDELTRGAVGALTSIAARGKVQARFAGAALGDFVAVCPSSATVTAALDGLGGLAADGVPGLLRGLDTKSPEVELDVVGRLDATADVRAAEALSARIEEKGDATLRAACVTALKRIGEPAVPALIAALKSKATRRYAGIVLYEITGQTHGEDVKAWLAWWNAR